MKASQILLTILSMILTGATGAHAATGSEGLQRVGVSESTYSTTESARGKNAFAAELLGRGLVWGLSYDRMVSEEFALGIGYSSWGAHSESRDFNFKVQVIPVYANYYFLTESHRPFVSAGFDILNASWDWDPKTKSSDEETLGFKPDRGRSSGSAVVPVLGGGYEYRSPGGFLFRGTLYEMIASSKWFTWFGLSVGFAL